MIRSDVNYWTRIPFRFSCQGRKGFLLLHVDTHIHVCGLLQVTHMLIIGVSVWAARYFTKKKLNTSNNLAVSSSSSSHIWSRTCSNFLHSSSFNMSSYNIFMTKIRGKFAENTFSKQECIPVGCAPPALPPQRGGGVSPWQRPSLDKRPPPPCGQNDRCLWKYYLAPNFVCGR